MLENYLVGWYVIFKWVQALGCLLLTLNFIMMWILLYLTLSYSIVLGWVGAQNEIVSAIQDVRKKVHPQARAKLSPEISALQNR